MSVETFAQFEAGLAQDHALTLRRFLALQTVGVDDAQRVRSVLNAAAVDAARVDVRALRAGLALLCAVDQREVLTALKTPVAVMLGGLDRIVPPCVVQAYQALCPGVRVFTQPRAGHAPFLYRNDVQNDGSDLGASLEWMQEVAR
jgi:pimeloyl-[acyl-carrier protein] methyl ester esterase